MKLLKKKGFGVLLLCLLATFMLVGCGGTEEEAAEENATVKIGLLNIDDSLPFFIAEQEGLFEKHGVQVELVSFGSARDKETALEAGEIDGDMTDLVVTGLLKKGGLDVKVVATALGAEPAEGRFLLLAAPNSGIETVADLKNQPIGIGNNTIIHFLADEICTLNGFTEEEIQTQNIPDLKLRLDTLLAGNSIQAAILPDPLASLGVMDGATLILDDTKLQDEDGNPLNLSQSVVIFTQESLESKGAEIAKVMAAYDEAKTLLNENPEQYRDALINFAKVPEALKESYAMPHYTTNTVPTAEEVERVMSWMQTEGLLDTAYTYEEIVDTSLLQ